MFVLLPDLYSLKEFTAATWLYAVRSIITSLTSSLSNLERQLLFFFFTRGRKKKKFWLVLAVDDWSAEEGITLNHRGFRLSVFGTIKDSWCKFTYVCMLWSKPSSRIPCLTAAYSHKAVKARDGQRSASRLSCLHMTCKAIHLYNLCEAMGRQNLSRCLHQTVQSD